ncbi:SDR family NAD(P)-dependent oxidoreductase [Saccharicrinis aurantiacus]|uniref:SDR family NAD(P)-dependent oxidoreductase n=1 Tax=Saccharicrinis aurantiacus TaxID=1849719 RepID=UPI000838390D|nr:SDR family NAD(P)-dependent oxidoreductase [Saccharicrinis aurantiacus]
MNKIALITGATSGIGMATAKVLAKLKYNLIITGRRKERLDQFSNLLQSEFGIHTKALAFDIRNEEETTAALNTLGEKWSKIDILINNAGLASGTETVDQADWTKWKQMIDTNITGLLFLSKEIIKEMVSRKQGHIVNISSIAGIQTYPGGSVYSATKHAVNAITKGMRIDLLPHNIKVSSVSPGMVDTEFSLVRFGGDQEKANNVYNGVDALLAEDIADAIEYIVTRPAHVNINDMLIMPTQQADATNIYRK